MVAVLGAAGCTPSAGSSRGPAAAAGGSGVSGGPTTGGVAWTRVNLGFVSAYLLVRGGEAAVVDTGVSGSDDEIGAALAGIGLEWPAVAHVILTHKHPDHAGSISAVLNAAPAATGYIGAGDLAAVQAPRALKPLNDGDRVFDLRIVGTPGHTIGHISVLDETGGVLVAGDALRTDGGPLAGSNPQFTEDAAAAAATVVKLGGLTFETLLPGHGEPILAGASAQVRALAGS